MLWKQIVTIAQVITGHSLVDHYKQYFGQRVDVFDSGNYRANLAAVELGVSYTPVPLMTLSASHKLGDGGESAEQYQLTLNYRLGVPIYRQLSADYVAEAHSLRGSCYDQVQRNTVPVLAFKQRKSLSVFLATPPWSRRIATRYDKTARNYLAMVKLGCIRLFYNKLCN